jgi:hypothetical protein
MRDTSQKRTLTQIIEKHLMDLQHETAVSGAVFVANVREHYEATYPEYSRSIEFSRVSDLTTRMTRDYEKFKRWLETDIKARFPLEILESVIMAFPAERRFRLQTELAARQNMLAVPMPIGDDSEDYAFLGSIAKKSGETMIAISKLLDDGEINQKDRKNAPDAIQKIDEAIAVLAAMKAVIERKALGDTSEPAKLKIASKG